MEEMIFDPMAWVNNNESTNGVSNQRVGEPNFRPSSPAPPSGNDDLAKVEAVVSELEKLGADITQTEPDWFRVGIALANGLGEAGHELYHRVSRLYPNYCYEECEKKWQHALKSNDGQVSISTFFFMAQQAGVDLSAIGRQFPSLPSFPQLEGNKDKNIGNPVNTGFSDKSNVFPQGEGSEGSEGFSDDEQQAPQYVETFSDKLEQEKLPSLLWDAMKTQQTPLQQDTVALGSLTVLSSISPNVFGRYGRKKVYAPFYSVINAPSASEKGQLPACEKLAEPVEREIERSNRQEREAYELAMKQYEMLDKATKKATTPPKEPPYRSSHIPLDSSATAAYQALSDNHGWGLSFETEADVLSQSLKSEYGDYSSGLRKAFHHERISYNRRKDNEHVNIAEPRWAILITCTPKQIPTLFSGNVENGMASRFMFYNQPRSVKWNDPFVCEELTIDEQFLQLGERYYRIYRKLNERRDRPIEFLFSVEQQQQFNRYFEELQLEQWSLHGDELVACVRRLGLVCFRIAMVLTVLRYEERPELLDEPSQSVVCSNDDFQTAMTIVNCLINHTGHVYANYIGTDEQQDKTGGAMMNEGEKHLFSSLSQEFTTQECKQKAKTLGIPWKTAERYIGNFISKYHIADRIKNGLYQKR
jgi:hypothetical protein